VHAISDLQIEYSLLSRDIEDTVLPVCRELQIGITAYGVLSRGLLGGDMRSDAPLANTDFRAHSPRFQNENRAANLQLVEALRGAAQRLGLSPAQAAIAWVAAQGKDIIPVIGARRRDRLNDALGALAAPLTQSDLALIEAAVPNGAAAGGRYPADRLINLKQ
jgi:aryl-alcohol dehydrogenase-like predicted oxidoreductase